MVRADSGNDQADPLIGTMVGRFRVVKKIGQGGMGAVYELLQPAIHKRMALKLLHEEYANRSEVVQRFFDEARAANLIGHPGIVDITDFGRLEDGRPFLIMEYLEGETLEDHLRASGPLPEEEVTEILCQIGSALGSAHSAGIIHRDLKPENVFLVRHPGQPTRVKLLDFGIAKLMNATRPANEGNTSTGAVMGTPTYMSPEQAQGKTKRADRRTDIYSLGVIVYEMLSGSPPFSGETFAALLYKHLNAEPPNPRDSRPDLSPRWTHIVAKAMAKAPANRYASVEALLQDAIATDGTVTETPGPSAHRFKDRAAVAAVFAAVIFAVAGGLLLRSGKDAHPTASKPRATARPHAPSVAAFDAAPARTSAFIVDAGHATVDLDAMPDQTTPRPSGSGTLRVTANPWAHVYLDGKRIGQTPLQQNIPVGRHAVRLENDTTGASRTHRFRLKKGVAHTIHETW